MSSPQDRITAFWSKVADGYESHPGNVEQPGSAGYESWCSVIWSALPREPARILDVATGTGFAALIAARAGHEVTGIDLAEPMLAVGRSHAREQGLQVSFTMGDAVEPPFRAGSFDIVMSRHLLWTLREPEVAFRNWRTLLRPGGGVVAIDGLWELASDEPGAGEPDSANVFTAHYTAETMGALPIQRVGTLDNLAAMLTGAGFVGVTVEALKQLPPPEDGPAIRYLARGLA